MEHKKFLEIEKIVSKYIENSKSARELTLEIVDFLEKPDFKFGLDFGTGRNTSGVCIPRENVCINNPSAGASI